MFDRHQRRIHYLRLSVTDRCNLRCVYCRPEEGLDLSRTDPVLSLEELHEVARVALSLGIEKIRLTGGEPLYRRGIVDLVRMIGVLPGLNDFAMTTNGVMLPRYAHDLKAAGLRRVNVSLDTLAPARFREVTRVGRVEDVLAGIEAAVAAGLAPVKINCVVRRTSDEPDARAVRAWADARNLPVRFIREMNMATGEFWQVEGGSGGHCATCGRLRVTSTGDVLPCLFSDLRYNVRTHGIEGALRLAVQRKPPSGKTSKNNRFYTVGG